MQYLTITADSVQVYTVPDEALDISRDTDHIRDALRGDNGAWGRMAKSRAKAIQAMTKPEQATLLSWVERYL